MITFHPLVGIEAAAGVIQSPLFGCLVVLIDGVDISLAGEELVVGFNFAFDDFRGMPLPVGVIAESIDDLFFGADGNAEAAAVPWVTKRTGADRNAAVNIDVERHGNKFSSAVFKSGKIIIEIVTVGEIHIVIILGAAEVAVADIADGAVVAIIPAGIERHIVLFCGHEEQAFAVCDINAVEVGFNDAVFS